MADPTLAEVIEENERLQSDCLTKQAAFFEARKQYRDATSALVSHNAEYGAIIRKAQETG